MPSKKREKHAVIGRGCKRRGQKKYDRFNTHEKDDEPYSKQPAKRNNHLPPNIPNYINQSTAKTSEKEMNPHPPSDNDERYLQFLSCLNNSLEIHPMDYEELEESTHLSTKQKMTLKNQQYPKDIYRKMTEGSDEAPVA